ncbi:MAG TPA: hypothetical protein VF897_20735, partial [Roseiflexaceae bacterium]
YRRLPELVVTGGAQDSFVEYEWNKLKLRVRNAGHGPASNIAIALRGAFDVDGRLAIARLAPNKSASVEAFVRPLRDQYGPAVPLEIVVAYEDVNGGRYEVSRRVPLRVVPQGAGGGTTTPLEIQIRGDRLPQADVGAAELPESSAAPRGAAYVAGQDEIDQQRSLLDTYRRNLARYLKQQAELGGTFISPGVANGIHEAREHIRRIKGILRGWGVVVADYPDDMPS